MLPTSIIIILLLLYNIEIELQTFTLKTHANNRFILLHRWVELVVFVDLLLGGDCTNAMIISAPLPTRVVIIII